MSSDSERPPDRRIKVALKHLKEVDSDQLPEEHQSDFRDAVWELEDIERSLNTEENR